MRDALTLLSPWKQEINVMWKMHFLPLKDTLISEIGNLKLKSLYKQALLLFKFTIPSQNCVQILHLLSTQSLSFFVLSIPHECITSLSKKNKSCLFWSFLRQFCETSMWLNYNLFLFLLLIWAVWILLLAHSQELKMGRGGNGPLPNIGKRALGN